MKLIYRLFLVLAIFAFALSAISFFRSVSANEKLPERSAYVSEQTKEHESYVLRRSGDRLAVFKSGESEPLSILDVYVSELPERDRELLESGIIAENEDKLNSLIEDYTS